MKKYRADLHVHTVLSPCAEVEMIPPLIVQKALELNIDLIAITDHNASANVYAVQRAAAGSNLKVLPGMEVQTREDVHLLCLFEELNQLDNWQSEVNKSLPNSLNQLFYQQLRLLHYCLNSLLLLIGWIAILAENPPDIASQSSLHTLFDGPVNSGTIADTL